ncbi:hypothetical protein RHGRI_024525 [Rhododendron griersonianum]|uniref:C2H2-type domain-containing protein n=1 Tax=Rhododendron griersonianum TaxID=479676 RepID=A0AAV6JBU3_9ERIC|nr:hypothetical protein RHGRI_024525 [Rhododendron griersonianum]
MDRTRATLLYMFLCIALFGRGTITQGNQLTVVLKLGFELIIISAITILLIAKLLTLSCGLCVMVYMLVNYHVDVYAIYNNNSFSFYLSDTPSLGCRTQKDTQLKEHRSKKNSILMKYIAPEKEVEQLGKLLRRTFSGACNLQYLKPFVEREKHEISRNCRLHPENDIFRDQEQHKIPVDINEWRCGYCNKIFEAEKFLDQHFDSRHYDLLNVSHSKCLADLCGALHCDLVVDSNSKSSKIKCNTAAAARNHHFCESLANSCFAVNHSPSANRLHELFLRQFCDAHTCSGGRKPFSRGRRKHSSILYLAISILTLMLLPVFYVIVYLYQRENRKGTQVLKRVSQLGQKAKPS